ncbi:MAG: hypothetical protein ACRDV9_15230, partial [Acidimicrobiia bacterium]
MRHRAPGDGRRLAAAVASLAILGGTVLGGSSPASADRADRVVTTTPDGVRVELERRLLYPFRRWLRGRQGRAGPPPPQCSLRGLEGVGPSRIVPFSPTGTPAASGPLTWKAFELRCVGGAPSVILLPVGPVPISGAREIAERVVREIPMPVTALRTSPPTIGLTGLESQVWSVGYQGEPIRAVVEELGARVEVEARPSVVHIDYGDGVPAATSPADDFFGGHPAGHVYQRSSGLEKPYP